MAKGMLSEEERLRKRLKKIVAEREAKEALEKNKEVQDAYIRCKDATYLIQKAKWQHYITLRKVSNVRLNNNPHNFAVICDVHEEIRINIRKDNDKTEFYEENCYYSGADFIEFVKLRKTNDNFVQDDEPIDEANYLKAKEFAVNQLKVIDTFFNDNPIFSYEK